MSAPDLLLNSKTVAALIGRSPFTLRRARSDRPDLDMPPGHRTPSGEVSYSLRAVIAWAQRRGVRLHWAELPTRRHLGAGPSGTLSPDNA